MQYFEDKNNKIQAGFALNAGKLLHQYQNFSKSFEETSRFDATLTICVLQSMLTNCWELLNSMAGDQKGDWLEPLTEIPQRWGLKQGFVERDTYPTSLTYIRFIGHLRNALSHPTYPEKNPALPSTGYVSLSDSSGLIDSFRFTDSPWVDRGRLYSSYENNDASKVRDRIKNFEKNHSCNIDIAKNERGNYQPVNDDGTPYYPVFIAEIPLKSLIPIAKELANYLAQPAQANWNGKTINQLVA